MILHKSISVSRSTVIVMVVAGFAVTGIVLLATSSAAVNFVAVEPENGVASTGALAKTDSSASGGKTVVFGQPLSASTAASKLGWGPRVSGDEFDNPTAFWNGTSGWVVHHGVRNQWGTRDRGQVSVADGVLRIVGSKSGGIGGHVGFVGDVRKYGRWEVRERIVRGDEAWKPVHLLWPTSEVWPRDGEVDYREGPAGGSTGGPIAHVDFTLHFARNGAHALHKTVVQNVDLRQWHHYAVEWTPTYIRGYIDGVKWYESADTSMLPPGPMWTSIQLDWNGVDSQTTDTLWEVDWLRIHNL